MKTKYFFISLSLFLITITYYLLAVSYHTNYSKGEAIPFLEFNEEELFSIQFSHQNKTTTLISTDHGWCVKERNNYPADNSKIKSFLSDLRRSKVQRNLVVGKSQLERLQLQPPKQEQGAIQVTLLDKKRKVFSSFLLGKAHTIRNTGIYLQGRGEATGRYALIDHQISLLDRPFNSTNANPSEWLDPTFIHLGEIVRLQLSFFNHMNDNWEIKQDDKSKKLHLQGLKPHEKANIANIRKIMPFFQKGGSQFSDVETHPEILANNQPYAGITIENNLGIVYQIILGIEVGQTTLCNLKVTSKKNLKPDQLKRFKKEKTLERYTYQLPTSKLKGLLQGRKDMISQTSK
jgi:hypothetical protein